MRILRIIIYLLASEIFLGLFAFLINRGRPVESLNWFTGFQIAFFVTIIFFRRLLKHKNLYFKGNSPNTKGKIQIFSYLLVIIVFMVVWLGGIFPELISISIKNSGRITKATVLSHRLLVFGARKAEFTTNSLSKADAIEVKISYDHYTSTILIYNNQKGFYQIGQESQNNSKIIVSYLPLFPVIVFPVQSLN